MIVNPSFDVNKVGESYTTPYPCQITVYGAEVVIGTYSPGYPMLANAT